MPKIRVTVWGENLHEQDKNGLVAKIYPQSIHECIAAGLNEALDIKARTAWFQQSEHGLTEKVLANTEVLFWWGHVAHDQVQDAVVDRVQRWVLQGMGLVVLHSALHSKIYRRLMGTSCNLSWRETGDLERVWVCNPGHPIAQGLGPYFEVPHTEMYGEPLCIPAPDEQVFISWYEGGEVFRSGSCWRRGNGKIFYFSPGHETFPIYHQPEVKLVLKNAARWARPQGSIWIDEPTFVTEAMIPEKRISKRNNLGLTLLH
jgi:trehalose utilization protein